VPTLEQIRHVIQTMPASTDIERRDRALVAFTILTGARDGAIASLKLKHIDIDQGRVDQDARQVKTKFSKSFTRRRSFPSATTSTRYVDWVITCGGRSSEASTIRYSRQRKSWSVTLGISSHRGSTASIGAAPVPSGLFSRTRRSCSPALLQPA
jgi:integrase